MKFRVLPIYSLLLLMFSCFQQPEYTSPKGYNLLNPEKFIRGEELLEISGIDFRDGKPDSVFAINDEDGKLFAFALGKKKNKSVRFGKGGDYEDIAILNNRAFILRSDGKLFSFPMDSMNKKKVEPVEWKEIVPKGEYEGLYADNTTGKLYMLCKSCGKGKEKDKDKHSVMGYILTLSEDSSTPNVQSFQIDSRILKDRYDIKGQLKPSALARNEATGEWYILSAVQKVLVITDSTWNITEMHRLSPSLFSQPEGIAFDNANNLYISNEGHELTNGNVLRFNVIP